MWVGRLSSLATQVSPSALWKVPRSVLTVSVVAEAFAAMPRTVAASGNGCPAARQVAPESSLKEIRPADAAHSRCGTNASATIMSTGASRLPSPPSRQVRPPSWLVMTLPSRTAASMSRGAPVAVSAVIRLVSGSPGTPT
jgi:hypothetical protein